jgi:hypothetical protein
VIWVPTEVRRLSRKPAEYPVVIQRRSRPPLHIYPYLTLHMDLYTDTAHGSGRSVTIWITRRSLT